MVAKNKLTNLTGVKLTTLREKIYLILSESRYGLSAYEILSKLKASHPKANAMSVYRTLNYFKEKHLIHRLEVGNKYTVCDKPELPCSGFILCSLCGQHRELHDVKLNQAITAILKKEGFAYQDGNLEIKALCLNCNEK